MEIIRNDGTKVEAKRLSFSDWRLFMYEFMSSPEASKAWDVLSCVRGPDSPSETSDMEDEAHEVAYRGRRNRKYNTVEVIRNIMFHGRVGGSARHHSDNTVTIAPPREQDHFDRHVERAATILGIKVKYASRKV